MWIIGEFEDDGLEIEGVDSTNPVVLENGAFLNPEDGAYLWAKASMGRLDLRGTIVSYAKDTGRAAVEANMRNCERLIRIARNSGMTGMPDPVAGSRRMLVRAPGGRLEDILPDSSKGALLLVEEARKATSSKPLVLISGVNLTTAAEALLIDPGIADRMVIFGANNDNYNNGDSLALALISRKARFVAWARDYAWPRIGKKSPDLFPGNRLGEAMRSQYSLDTGSALTVFAFYGDFGAATYLYDNRVWSGASASDLKGPPLKARISGRAAFDFIDIPEAATDWEGIQDEFFSAITDPAAYHPRPWEGRIEAEAYGAIFNAAADSDATADGDRVAFKGTGSWAEYPVLAAAAGDFTVEFRYRAANPSGIGISADSADSSAQVDLPAAADWSIATGSLHLEAGEHELRVESVQGALDLDWMRVVTP